MATGHLGSLNVDRNSLKELKTFKTGESRYGFIKKVIQSNDTVPDFSLLVKKKKSFSKRYTLKYTTMEIKAMNVIKKMTIAIMVTITLTDDDDYNTATP